MASKRNDIMIMDELAEYLKISKSTLYKLAVESKKFPEYGFSEKISAGENLYRSRNQLSLVQIGDFSLPVRFRAALRTANIGCPALQILFIDQNSFCPIT